MLIVLGGLAEFERELIRARMDDGRNALTSHQIQVARARRAAGGAAGGDRPVLQRLALDHFKVVAISHSWI